MPESQHSLKWMCPEAHVSCVVLIGVASQLTNHGEIQFVSIAWPAILKLSNENWTHGPSGFPSVHPTIVVMYVPNKKLFSLGLPDLLMKVHMDLHEFKRSYTSWSRSATSWIFTHLAPQPYSAFSARDCHVCGSGGVKGSWFELTVGNDSACNRMLIRLCMNADYCVCQYCVQLYNRISNCVCICFVHTLRCLTLICRHDMIAGVRQQFVCEFVCLCMHTFYPQ